MHLSQNPRTDNGRLTMLFRGDVAHTGLDNISFVGCHQLVAVERGSACGNDGDNEITGIHTSIGDPGSRGILGAQTPQPFRNGWRVFYTRQHGDNVTFEIILNPALTAGGEH